MHLREFRLSSEAAFSLACVQGLRFDGVRLHPGSVVIFHECVRRQPLFDVSFAFLVNSTVDCAFCGITTTKTTPKPPLVECFTMQPIKENEKMFSFSSADNLSPLYPVCSHNNLRLKFLNRKFGFEILVVAQLLYKLVDLLFAG